MLISEYFASFSLRVDRSSVKRVDTVLDNLDNRLKLFGKNNKIKLDISGFNVNQSALNLALGNSLDLASNVVAFEISRFVVNDRNLLAALLRAARRLPPLPPGPNPPPGPPLPPRPIPPDNRIRRDAMGGGLIGGGLSRVYGPALALGLGGYGLSQLNQRNQQVVSAQLQSSAVVQQAGGTVEQGAESFQYLRKEANRIGFNYLDASQDYNKLISGLTGSGVSVKESQKVFSGFAELARVNKLDKTTQNRLFRALSQVAGKGKLQAEELTGQISEALPGGTALFAQAYQRQLKATGKGKGDLTGQAAIQALLADMKKGIVNSGILTYAGSTASDKAQTGLALAQTASQAEQQRYQNSVNDLAVVASDAGVEEGFARIFRTLNAGLSESNGLVRILSEGFNDATKWADDLLLWPQSFVRALEGRDSLVADWLGKDDIEQLRADWKDIKQIFTDISALKFDFLPTLKATSAEIASILNGIAAIQRFRSGDLPTETKKYDDIEKIDPFGTGEYTSPKGIFDAGLNNFGVNLSNAKVRGRAVYEDPSSPFYQKPELFDANKEFNLEYYRNISAMERDPTGQGIGDAVRTAEEEDALTYKLKDSLERRPKSLSMFSLDNRDPIESSLGLNRDNIQTPDDIASQNRDAAIAQAEASVVNNVTNQFDITISVDATLAGIEIEQQAQAMAQAFSTSLTGAFEQVQVNFPTKG